MAPSVAHMHQTSSGGETAAGEFDSNLEGGQSDCLAMSLIGTAEVVSVSFYFETVSVASWPADMIFSINNGTNCVLIGGYDIYVVDNCDDGKLGSYSWPSSMETEAFGVYNASADVTASQLSGNGTWTVQTSS
jgi:hypothetical protein